MAATVIVERKTGGVPGKTEEHSTAVTYFVTDGHLFIVDSRDKVSAKHVAAYAPGSWSSVSMS